MKKLPIDLNLKVVTAKVSVNAWERAQELKAKHGGRLSDIVSVCLLYMPEDKLAEILEEHQKIYDSLPRSVKGLLKNIDSLDEDQRALLRDALS